MTDNTIDNLMKLAIDDYYRAVKLCDSEGEVQITKTGYKTAHPAVRLRRDAFDRFVKLIKLSQVEENEDELAMYK